IDRRRGEVEGRDGGSPGGEVAGETPRPAAHVEHVPARHLPERPIDESQMIVLVDLVQPSVGEHRDGTTLIEPGLLVPIINVWIDPLSVDPIADHTLD